MWKENLSVSCSLTILIFSQWVHLIETAFLNFTSSDNISGYDLSKIIFIYDLPEDSGLSKCRNYLLEKTTTLFFFFSPRWWFWIRRRYSSWYITWINLHSSEYWYYCWKNTWRFNLILFPMCLWVVQKLFVLFSGMMISK